MVAYFLKIHKISFEDSGNFLTFGFLSCWHEEKQVSYDDVGKVNKNSICYLLDHIYKLCNVHSYICVGLDFYIPDSKEAKRKRKGEREKKCSRKKVLKLNYVAHKVYIISTCFE